MFLVPIAFVVVVLGYVEFIRWAVPSCVCNDVVLEVSITKLECSMFHMTRDINRVPIYART